MSDEEPERLKATGDTPDELKRALNALGRDRDGERLARVATRLSATLAASGVPAGGAVRQLLSSKLALTSMVVGLSALGFLGYQLSKHTEPPVQAPQAPAPIAPQPVLQPAAASAPEPRETSEPPSEHAPASTTSDSGERRVRDEQPRSKRAPSGAASESSRASDVQRSAAANPTELAPIAVDETAAAQEQVPSEPEDIKPAGKTAPAPPPASEGLLLYNARKAASSRPSEALRLLDEHAARFPNGLLVPEREVLAIEVLRSLGRDAEAAQRLQRFKARYPQSMHLRRLEQGGGSGDSE